VQSWASLAAAVKVMVVPWTTLAPLVAGDETWRGVDRTVMSGDRRRAGEIACIGVHRA